MLGRAIKLLELVFQSSGSGTRSFISRLKGQCPRDSLPEGARWRKMEGRGKTDVARKKTAGGGILTVRD